MLVFLSTTPVVGQGLHRLQPCTPGEPASGGDPQSHLSKQIDAWAREVDRDSTVRSEVPFLGFLAALGTLFRGRCGLGGFGEGKAPC